MRASRVDDYRVVKARLDALASEDGDLRSEQARVRAELETKLGDGVNRGDAARLRAELTDVGLRLQEVTEEVAAVKKRLPAAADRKKADSDARDLQAFHDETARRLDAVWSRLVSALTEAEGAARELVTARRDQRRTAARLEELVARFGLDAEVPRTATPTDQQVVYLAATLVAEAVLGEPRDVLVRDLDGARRRLAS